MKANSKLASVAIVSAIAGATFLGANAVSAQGDNQTLVERLADRFSVSESEVQEVFDEFREEKQTEHKAEHDEHLTSLVEDGTLSEEQRQELEAFHQERKALREELRTQNLSREEMREAMEGLRDEVEAWAESKGIELENLRPNSEDRPHRHGHRHGGLQHMLDAGNDTSSDS